MISSFLAYATEKKSRKMPMTILFYLSSIRIICLKTQNTELWWIISQIILSNNPFSCICSVFIVLMFDRKKQKLRREAQLLGKQLKLIWLETSLGAGIFEYLRQILDFVVALNSQKLAASSHINIVWCRNLPKFRER